MPPLYLGEPDFNDVESAARLLVRYRNEGGLTPDGAEMFFMMVERPDDVLALANELAPETNPEA